MGYDGMMRYTDMWFGVWFKWGMAGGWGGVVCGVVEM